MKRALIASALIGALAIPATSYAAELDTHEKKLSYIMGLKVGADISGVGYEVDLDAFAAGLKDSLATDNRQLSDDEMRETMQHAQVRYQERQQQAMQELATKNQAEGEAFLSDNAKQPGVVQTDSGLQYQILSEGSGESPKATDTVKVHYRGTLLDGTVFDSSYDRGEPVAFPLNGVIAGWTEGLQLLKPGAKAKLFIPSQLAYGPGGMGNTIGPNATLIFEVELLEINPQ